MIDEARQPVTFTPPGDPIDMSELRGKTIAIVVVTMQTPTLAAVAGAAQEAAEVAGLETTLFDAKADVPRMIQGVEDAIRRADAMLLIGIPIAVVQDQLEQAKDAGIPAVSVLNNQPAANEPGQGAGPLVYASSAPDFRKAGQLVASQAIVDTDGEANVEIFTANEIQPSADTIVGGMMSMLERCEGCEVSQNSTPLDQWFTRLAPKAESIIRRNPELNYMLPIFDIASVLITPAIERSGVADRVKTASINGTPAALQLIQSGDVVSADVGASSNLVGWHSVDQAARGLLGHEPGEPTIPSRLLDDSTLEGEEVDDFDAPYGDDLGYREGFQELWGVR
ncbi:MAG: substrate-binding domain-containing protein [Thermoleophilaceae bacterium]